jgi:glycosyltransferase involved in cell wall biosynthesis
VGYKVPPTNETDVISQMQEILADLADNRELLYRLRRQGMSYARECLTWDAKARRTTRVLDWVLRQGPKPELTPSTMLQIERVS